MNGKITCIGTGSMGGAIFRAVCKEIDSSIITVTNRTAAKGEAFAKETGCNFSSSAVSCRLYLLSLTTAIANLP